MGPDQQVVTQFAAAGWALARGLFSPTETEALTEHFMRLRTAGSYPGDTAGVDAADGDPLRRFPRMIHMHRWDDISLRWMTDTRLNAWMTAFCGIEPLAVQTMLYFKPPGARGQALHQDQYYLKARPGTCLAAWLALDDCDEENGCLQIVPGTQDLPVLCPVRADTTLSFTDVTVPLPEGYAPVPVPMRGGDVLFFNGSLIHGSLPNRTSDRFRRALIGHYVTGDAREVARFYHPVLQMDGSPVDLGESPGGGPCGHWVDLPAGPRVAMTGTRP